jgi:hypothetical protein
MFAPAKAGDLFNLRSTLTQESFMTFTSPNVAATTPRIPYPLPTVPDVPTPRPAFLNFAATSEQFTNLKQLYQSVQALDQQLAQPHKDIDFILSQLSPAEIALLPADIQALRQEVIDAKANADRKFSEQVSLLGLWHVYNDPRYPTEIQKLAVLGYVISRMHSDARRATWESEYGVARLHEIEVKQKLVDTYRTILPTLNEVYLLKFYPGFANFPPRTQIRARELIDQIGAFNLHDGFLDNKVEILISDSRLTPIGSQFGHVAINIGGVIYGRAPAAWDIRGKEKYLLDQGSRRSTIGYVIQLDDADKRKLFESIVDKIVKDAKYSLVDHSCSGEIVASFAELGINVVDPRWTVGDIYAPADIDNFLKHAKQVIQTNLYPMK